MVSLLKENELLEPIEVLEIDTPETLEFMKQLHFDALFRCWELFDVL